MAEAKLQKLKVTELKDLLSKNGLVQSGKKEELVKRLLDAGVTGDESEELVDLPDVPAESAPASIPAPAPAAVPAPAPAAPAPAVAPTQPAPAASAPAPAAAPATAPAATDAPAEKTDEPEEEELTEEEKKQKARAERFNIPWVRQKKPAAAPPKAKAEEKPAAPKAEKEKPAKPSAIDATPLGIPAEVLARRAAKFGLQEKKAEPAQETKVEEKKELSEEEKARIAEDEERKRKRAEKFGPVATNGGDAPDAKKAKV